MNDSTAQSPLQQLIAYMEETNNFGSFGSIYAKAKELLPTEQAALPSYSLIEKAIDDTFNQVYYSMLHPETFPGMEHNQWRKKWLRENAPTDQAPKRDEGYESQLEAYLKNGINYSANTIAKADVGDLQQLAADSFHYGYQAALQSLEKEPEDRWIAVVQELLLFAEPTGRIVNGFRSMEIVSELRKLVPPLPSAPIKK